MKGANVTLPCVLQASYKIAQESLYKNPTRKLEYGIPMLSFVGTIGDFPLSPFFLPHVWPGLVFLVSVAGSKHAYLLHAETHSLAPH